MANGVVGVGLGGEVSFMIVGPREVWGVPDFGTYGTPESQVPLEAELLSEIQKDVLNFFIRCRWTRLDMGPECHQNRLLLVLGGRRPPSEGRRATQTRV